MVIATDSNAYTIEVSRWRTTKPTRLVSKHALGSVPTTRRALSLQIDDEERLYAFLFQFADMKEIAALINGGEGRAGEPAAQPG